MFKEEENIDVKTKKIAIDMQVAQQVPVDDDYFYETYGVPKPSNYDEMKAAREAARAAVLSASQDPDPDNADPDEPVKDPKDPEIKKPVKASARQRFAERLLSFFS